MRLWALRELRESARSYAASVAVVAVVAAFALLLLEAIDVLVRTLSRSGLNEIAQIQTALTSVGFVFLGISALTATIVISGTFATIYAGRLRDISLLRLVGATSRQVRRAARIDGLAVGIAGAVAGMALGVVVAAGAIAALNSVFAMGLEFAWTWQLLVVPSLVCVVVSLLSANAGAKKTAAASPAGGLRHDAESTRYLNAETRRRRNWMLVLGSIGLVLLAAGFVVGLSSPLGLLVAFPGGVFSIAGLIVGAHSVTGPIVVSITRLLPRTAPHVLAGANLRSDTVRTSRTVVSILIGVTLITMFTVAGDMYLEQLRDFVGSGEAAGTGSDNDTRTVTVMLAVVYTLTAFSVLVAVIGIGSNLTLAIVQRRREFAVLRSLGLTSRQVRHMVLVESVIVSVIGATLGLLLGTLYGFVGANATLGVRGTVPPVVSPQFLVVVVAAAVLFAAAASIAPGRRAALIPPAEALRQL